jgi:hypothetical protein
MYWEAPLTLRVLTCADQHRIQREQRSDQLEERNWTKAGLMGNFGLLESGAAQRQFSEGGGGGQVAPTSSSLFFCFFPSPRGFSQLNFFFFEIVVAIYI